MGCVSVPTCGDICHSLFDRRRHAGGLDGDAAAGQGDVLQRVAEPQPHLTDSAPGQPPTLRLQKVYPFNTTGSVVLNHATSLTASEFGYPPLSPSLLTSFVNGP